MKMPIWQKKWKGEIPSCKREWSTATESNDKKLPYLQRLRDRREEARDGDQSRLKRGK
jgi:hypothetical protein